MRPLLGHRWAVHSVAFAPDDPTRLASAGTDRILRLWSTATGETLAEVRHPLLGEVRHLAWTPTGSALVGGDRAGHLFRWERGSDQVLVENLEPGRPVQGLTMLDGVLVLAGGGGSDRPGGPGFLARWHLHSRALACAAWTAAVRGLAWEPDAGLLALAEEGRRLLLIDWAHPRQPRREIVFAHEPTALRFVATSDGLLLAVAQGITIELCDALTGATRRRLAGHRSTPTCLAATPDGRLLVSGSRDRTVRVWSLPDGGVVAAYHWEIGPIAAVAVAPDGLTAAACGEKPSVIVWDLD